jgi:trehalose 6-phosphate synthase
VIIVAHRGPVRFERDESGAFHARRGAGGLAGTLGPLLTHHRDGDGGPVTWVAAAMSDDDRAAAAAGETELHDVDLQLLTLDPREHRLHYDIVSNATLWFLYHGLFDLPRRPLFDARFREAWDAYVAVNTAFATRVAEVADADEVVLVQDYQLALVPGVLAARRPDLRVVHFTHTPFCGPNSIRVLPNDVAHAICASMAAVPAGFHTRRWADAFQASAATVLGAEHPRAPVFALSLGPDPTDLYETAKSPAGRAALDALEESIGDRRLVLRSDRVEPSKNIVRGFLAFDRLLDEHPEWRERVVFAAMLNASRESLPEYQAYRQEVEQAAARVNDRWARGDWEPVLMDMRDDFPRSVAGYQRYDALLVNPIKDGLNLVAKEGPLVNRRDGVVCLSTEAGAFDELQPAVLAVHPYDLDQTAGALHEALVMPDDARHAQASRLHELAAAVTPAGWLQELINVACR